MLKMKRKRDYDGAKIKEQWKEQFGFEINFNTGLDDDEIPLFPIYWIYDALNHEDIISFSREENFSKEDYFGVSRIFDRRLSAIKLTKTRLNGMFMENKYTIFFNLRRTESLFDKWL